MVSCWKFYTLYILYILAMNEGVYLFRFGSNQSVRIYYYRRNFHLEVDPNFMFGKKEKNEKFNLSSSPSTSDIQLKLDYGNFRYCMNHHGFKQYQGSDKNARKQVIKCEVLDKNSLISNASIFSHLQFITDKSTQCSWFWQPENNSFRISLIVNESLHFAKTSDVNLEYNDVTAALTCEVGQWDRTGGVRKRIKFAIPFIISNVFQPTARKLLYHLGKRLSSPTWVAFASIMTVVAVFATAYCCRKTVLSSSHKLR